jgi:hypothetical protein
VKAHRIVRHRGFHIFKTVSSQIVVRLSELCTACPLPLGRFLVLIYVRLSWPQALSKSLQSAVTWCTCCCQCPLTTKTVPNASVLNAFSLVDSPVPGSGQVNCCWLSPGQSFLVQARLWPSCSVSQPWVSCIYLGLSGPLYVASTQTVGYCCCRKMF